MTAASSTCWSIIHGAARGSDDDRRSFVARYRPVIERFFRARWTGLRQVWAVDDAVQDVLFECLKSNGVLAKSSGAPPRSFRAVLVGTARNVALRYEDPSVGRRRETQVTGDELSGVIGADEPASHAFERAWAEAVVRQSADRMQLRARILGPRAERRFQLLRLRHFEGRPIREIARSWGKDAIELHREYARAREEFRVALLEVLDEHHPNRPEEARAEALHIVGVLSDRKAARLRESWSAGPPDSRGNSAI